MARAGLWFTSLPSLFKPTCLQVKLRQWVLKHTRSQITCVEIESEGIMFTLPLLQLSWEQKVLATLLSVLLPLN